jgi:hypothetical protein
MQTHLYTLWHAPMWRTTRARCEVVSQPLRQLRVVVWLEGSLVFEAVVSTASEAQDLAAGLQMIYAP